MGGASVLNTLGAAVLLAPGLLFSRAVVAPAARATAARAPETHAVVYVPAALRRGVAPAITPWPSPVPGETSRVLEAVPVPPAAELTFFEQRNAPPAVPPAGGVAQADYVVNGMSPSAVVAWIEARLPSHGWQRSGAGGWVRFGGHRLSLRASTTPSGAAFRLVADAGSAAAADVSLAASVPLPLSTRRRYDPMDLIVEEVAVPQEPLAAYLTFSATLSSAGWHADADQSYAGARIGRFVKATERVLLAAWADPQGTGAEVAIGPAGCLPPPDLLATRSVYLQDVAGPPGAQLVGYEHRSAAGVSIEEWREGCIDLDLFGALMAAAAGEGWTAVTQPRSPGRLSALLVPSIGPTVTVSARPAMGGQVALELSRDESGRAPTTGSSLLSSDVPLPAIADARSMTVDAPGWSNREVYDLPGFSLAATDIWLREHVPAQGWSFERTEPETDGTGLVFYAAGEELFMELADDSVAIQRRRTCPDGLGRIPAGDATDARWLLEVPVVPGAAYDGWDGLVEGYRLTCADLGLLADWYRARMESGNWALAGTSIPSATARELLFVRPAELGLPHEMRTAWATVVLRRAWPYHYEITLGRDPAGIRTP